MARVRKLPGLTYQSTGKDVHASPPSKTSSISQVRTKRSRIDKTKASAFLTTRGPTAPREGSKGNVMQGKPADNQRPNCPPGKVQKETSCKENPPTTRDPTAPREGSKGNVMQGKPATRHAKCFGLDKVGGGTLQLAHEKNIYYRPHGPHVQPLL